MRLPLAFALALSASVLAAQDQPNTVLVMDGSGSLWGQIDGVAKITIAQDVVANLLSDFPADQGLGLTLYGHRERGVCTDIETVVAPAPGTAAQITAAVKGIKPLGKTPMTDAVIAAAQALRYTEDKATVILVSDGVETCNPDPCAAARLLEEAGIDFTAHVIGFDVGSDADALAQMQCIAEETGGQFLTADTADQLAAALSQVAVVEPAPEPEPALVPATFSAVMKGAGTPVVGPVLWDVTGSAGPVAEGTEGNPLTLKLAQGSYTATAYSVALETELSQQFVAIGNAATVQVEWTGPAYKDDYIGIGLKGAKGAGQWQAWRYTRDGAPAEITLPDTPGTYLVRSYMRLDRTVLAEQELIVE